MTDKDWLGLEDPAEMQAERGPALLSRERIGPRELEITELMHRRDDQRACTVLIFTEVGDDDGVERWASAARGDASDQGLIWQDIMSWPRIPTIEEAERYKGNAIAARLAKWWPQLAEARALDEAAARPGKREKPPQ